MAGALAKRAPRVEHVMGARLRILALLLVAALLGGAVWARLAYWQVLCHVQLSAQAHAQIHEVVQPPAVGRPALRRKLAPPRVHTTAFTAIAFPPPTAPGVFAR